MNALAWFFETTYMAQVGGPLIFLAFLVHFVLAARKVPFKTSEQRVMLANAKRMHHTDTWLWIVQATTAMGILIMGGIHMWVVLTNLPITAAKSAARIQTGFWFVFYLFLLPMQNKHAEAVADLTKAIDATKTGKVQALYYKNRGLSYGAMSKFDEAKADFKKAKEIDPKIKIPMMISGVR